MNKRLLINTRLNIPQAGRWHLPRPHLEQALNAGMSRRVTTLIAAAGHGKTSTLAYFVRQLQEDVRHLWIQLDSSDSELSNFLHYLAYGITSHLGGGTYLSQALSQEKGGNQAVELTIADLDHVTEPIVIVLDDFHLIDRTSPVVQFVQQLIQYSNPNVHFYICSRSSLPFSTARLKVIQEAGEITETDLRFTAAEIKSFVLEKTKMDLSDDQVEEIAAITEGWSAALVLLTSSLLRPESVVDFTKNRLPSDLFNYLTDELFQSLPPELQRFMEEASILDTCSISACEGTLECANAAELVAQAMTSHVLITPLSTDSFRFHHLLQRYLQERLHARDGSVTFRQLHKQAGDWYRQQELHEEAVKYYLRGNWVTEAATLVEVLAPIWMRHTLLERMRGLLAYLPTEIRENYPWITLCDARFTLSNGNPDRAMGLTRLALRIFQEHRNLRGVVQANTLMGEIFIARQDYEAAKEALLEASAALSPEFRHEEGVLLQRRAALNYQTNGASEEVENDLRRALAIAVEVGDLSGEAWVCNILGLVRASVGDFVSATRLLERSVEIFLSLGEPSYELGTNLAWVYSIVGRFKDAIRICEPMLTHSSRKVNCVYAGTHLVHLYCRTGDFLKAISVAQTTNALVEELGHKDRQESLAAGLSAVYRLSGEPATAVRYANEAMHLARQRDRTNLYVKPVLEAMLLHLFHTGNMASAVRTGHKALSRLGPTQGSPYERMMLQMALAVAEFRNSRTESRPEAVALLQEALAECSRRGYLFFGLHEWHLALCVIIYGLAYDVHTELCTELIKYLHSRLPDRVLKKGVPLMEPEGKLLPAAWQALLDEESRVALSELLTPGDRRRIVNLSVGIPPMRIQCLGALTVTLGNQPIDVKAMKKRKSGLLLTLLLCQSDPAPREQILERLWPDLDPEAADTSLRVTLHHLRRLLEPHLGGRSKSRYIQTEGGLVWFSRQPEVQIDLDHFRKSLSDAEEAIASGDLSIAASHYEAACRAYRGDLSTDDPYAVALEDIRNQLRERFADALDWLGNYYFHNQHTAKAILTFKQRLALDTAYESAHQALMRAYLETGHVTAARQQYVACKEALAAELGVQPSRTTESLLQLAISMERETTAVVEPERKPAKIQ